MAQCANAAYPREEERLLLEATEKVQSSPPDHLDGGRLLVLSALRMTDATNNFDHHNEMNARRQRHVCMHVFNVFTARSTSNRAM